MTETPTITEGTFFCSSWGYDQTNVTWFRVMSVSASGKTVMVQEWNGHNVPGDGPRRGCWVVRDGVRVYDADAEYPLQRKKLRFGGYRDASFHWKSYADAYLWDGNARYVTPFGMGH